MPSLTIPLPPISLKANRRAGAHWSTVEQDKQVYQVLCAAAARDQRRQWEGKTAATPVHLWAVMFLGYRQRADPSDVGFWLKGALDILVQMGVWGNDSAAHINPFTAAVSRSRDNPRVELYWGDGAASAAELAVSGRVVRVSKTVHRTAGRQQ